MLVVVTYDVSTETPEGRKRLRHVAKKCQNRGQRVQKSVFECLVDPAQWAQLRQGLIDEIDPEQDSLRFYFLSADDAVKTEHHGVRKPLDVDGPLLA